MELFMHALILKLVCISLYKRAPSYFQCDRERVQGWSWSCIYSGISWSLAHLMWCGAVANGNNSFHLKYHNHLIATMGFLILVGKMAFLYWKGCAEDPRDMQLFVRLTKVASCCCKPFSQWQHSFHLKAVPPLAKGLQQHHVTLMWQNPRNLIVLFVN